MPTIEELQTALVNADAAGDTAGAQILADHIRTLGNAPKNRTWGETATEALANAPESGWNMLKGVGQAVAHPINTAGNIFDLAAGELSKAMPESVNRFVDRIEPNPQSAERVRNTAEGFNQIYKRGYGSMEGFKERLATDPAAVLGDLSTVLTGTGAALGTVPKAARLSQMLSAAGNATNPLSAVPAVAKGVGKVADLTGSGMANVLGSPFLTGIGSEALKEGYRAGKTGQSSYMQNLTGSVPKTEVLDKALQGIANMRELKSEAYKKSMVDVKADKSVLNFENIDKSMSEALGRATYGGRIVDKKAYSALQEAKQEVNTWKSGDPNVFHTPEGLDALKRRIGDIQESLPFEEKNARGAIGNLYSSVKDEIAKQAPVYSKTMEDYAEATNELKEIQKALSLGQNASVDTAMRKLQSLTRNNVSTNYGNRLDLARALEQQGGNEILPSLAGQAANSWVGRGMASHIGSGAAIGSALANPLSLGILPFQSPKLMGTAAYGAGKVAGVPGKIGKVVPPDAIEFIRNNADRAKSLALVLQQMQQGNQ